MWRTWSTPPAHVGCWSGPLGSYKMKLMSWTLWTDGAGSSVRPWCCLVFLKHASQVVWMAVRGETRFVKTAAIEQLLPLLAVYQWPSLGLSQIDSPDWFPTFFFRGLNIFGLEDSKAMVSSLLFWVDSFFYFLTRSGSFLQWGNLLTLSWDQNIISYL